MQRNCEYCGKPFEAKRATARFCGSSCRAQATQRRQREGKAAGEVVTKMDQPDPDESPALVARVREALASAGKTGWRAQQAITLAERLATRGEAGAASLSKELDRVMGELLAGATRETDELDEITENVVPMRRRRA